MDISTVITYVKDLFATFTILFTMIFSVFGNSAGESFDVTRPDELVASFVVLSDVHVETNQPEAYEYLYQTLKGIRSGKSVDAVIYTGDNVMNGQVLEDFLFYTAVKFMKPAEKNFVLAGNHDLGNSAGDYESLLEKYISNNKRYLNEDVGKGYYYRIVNGCYIISLISEVPTTDEFVMSEEQFAWLEGVLQKAVADDAPIFVFNHFPLRFVGGSGERLAALLAEYNTDLFVHGHYHDHSINQGNFYTWGGVDSINMTRPTEMTNFDAGEGIVIEVYENEFIVRVRNFITGEWIENLTYAYEF